MVVTTPFETTPLIITEELYTSPLRPTQLITPSSTPPLQYPASPIVSPEVEAADRLAVTVLLDRRGTVVQGQAK